MRQVHPVFAVHRLERRDVELLLRAGTAFAVRAQKVGVAALVGVVHLGHDALKRARRIVAPVHGDRVERVAEHARPGQHDHPAAAQIHPAGGEPGVELGPDASRIRRREVVPAVEPGQRPQPPRKLRRRVQVD